MNLHDVLREFVDVFDRLGCRYAVMGGLAVRVYGIPRPTHDIDFTVAIPRTRLDELYREVAARGYSIPEAYRSGWIDRVAEMPVVKFRRYESDHGIDIDLFLAESKFQDSLIERSAAAEIDGIEVRLVSPEDLILLKLIAGRRRDLADIGDVLFTQGTLDQAYLQKWAAELGVTDRLDQALNEREF